MYFHINVKDRKKMFVRPSGLYVPVNKFTDFQETWYGRYATGTHSNAVTVSYPELINNYTTGG
jgi:hypothetical protein